MELEPHHIKDLKSDCNGKTLNTSSPSINHSFEITNNCNLKKASTMIKVTYNKDNRSPGMSNCSNGAFSDESSSDRNEQLYGAGCDFAKDKCIDANEADKDSSVVNNTWTKIENETEENGSVSHINDSRRESSLSEEVENSAYSINSNPVNDSTEQNSHSFSEIKVCEEFDSNCGTRSLRKRKSQEVVTTVESKKSKPEQYSSEDSSSVEEEEGEEEEEEDEEELLLDDPDLPPGWQRIIHTREGGASDGQNDVHILSPDGKRFRFRAKLKDFLEKTNSPYSIDRFYFGLYKKKTHGHCPKAPKNEVQVSKEKKKKIEKNETVIKAEKVPVSRNKTDGSEPDEADGDYKETVEDSSGLPEGWKRCVILWKNEKSKEKRRVCFISPDGKKYKQKKRLSDYLASIKATFSIDLFDFEDCTTRKYYKTRKPVTPKKEVVVETKAVQSAPEPERKKRQYIKRKHVNTPTETSPVETDAKNKKRRYTISTSSKRFSQIDNFSTPQPEKKKKRYQYSCPPMLHDPFLPTGWKRAIKVRNYGDSAGRMEVIIVSPDGRKHRNRGALEQYLTDKKLPYVVNDFDFTLFGRNHKKGPRDPKKIFSPKELFRSDGSFIGSGESYKVSDSSPKVSRTSFKGSNSSFKRSSSSPKVSDSSFKENDGPVVSKESAMISHVSGIMLSCGITSMRNERRLRMTKEEHEKVLKDYLKPNESEEVAENSEDSSEVPTKWIQDLAKCRSEFGSLNENAAAAVASATKEFLQKFAFLAFQNAKNPEKGLEYNDVADFVEKSECLSSLKVLIPKKITFKEFVRLSRPKKYISFT